MMDWDSLDQKYGLKPADTAPTDDPWAALDAKHLTPTKAAPSSEKAKPEPITDFAGNLRFATPWGNLDTGIGLPEGVNKRLAQLGSGFADWGLAGRQMLASDKPTTLSGLITGKTEDSNLRAEAAYKRQADAGLNDDFFGKALNFGGKVAPSLALPNVGGPLLTGVLGGATMGAFEPVAGEESRGLNMGLGGAIGAVIPGAMAAFRKASLPADSATADLARTAIDKFGIPLGPADVSSNGLIKGARSVLNDTPFIGGISGAQNAAKQGAFNRAVGQTFGADATSLTPTVMNDAKTRIGGELNRIWGGNNLKIDGQLINDLQGISKRAAQDLNPEQAALVERQIQKLLAPAQNAEVPGTFANNWQSELRLAVDGEKGLAKKVLSDLRATTLAAFNRGVSSTDAAALSKARGQYGNFMTVNPLMTKGELGVAGRTAGDVPATLLSGAVNTGMGNRAVGTDLGQLAQIGGRFVADRTAQTGGSPRALIQNSILGAGLTGGGFLGMGAGGALGVPALAAGTQWALGSPMLTKAMLKEGAKRGLLSAPQFTPAAIQAMRNGLLNSPAAMAPGLLGLNGPGS